MPNVWRLIAHDANSAAVADLIRVTGKFWIGWGEIGDLRQKHYRSAAEIGQAIRRDYFPSGNSGTGGPSVWRFFHEMQLGDLVIISTSRGREITMEITGPYEWTRNNGTPPLTGDYFHHRAARLTDLDPNVLFQQASGIAEGENVRWTVFRCALSITSQQR